MSCMLTLEEIEIKRQELERHLEHVMGAELDKWQRDNQLCVSDVNVRLANTQPLGSTKHNLVTGVSVELDYKP
ncbi:MULTISPECIES: hypothetical protein [Acinetobacter calcoaceticus/baumannii complex]|uniref:hypothetical protein n=1 Tax=Acinetobacter calcoaceticus/baumannii complex TaxID=909768 RepID=UPI00044BFF06|nr:MULTISPECIES: hypothetical protein [Acinetobacter calcoaceticus/baumannii complex]HEO1802086.1 hypothetical protein [Acinetobacter baumannii]EXA86126.1 hypothetical protein J508_3350 [Acinetobacter sp. 1289694]KQE54332.1 hypothetical protein APD49_16485 [Acinetobacter pittii]MCG5256901.1 hypothetical protein [Acinetobacter pittii]MCK0901493.1 hypothetical protein [Acinetobacter pittii]